MNLGALMKGLLVLDVPWVIRDAAGNSAGLKTGAGTPLPQAVVQAFPNTPQVYCSPIAGEADTANSTLISNVDHSGAGFIMPKAGIVTEIGYIAQGNTGAGTVRNLRWNIVGIEGDSAADAGLKIAANLQTGLSTVANNYNGVVAITGLALAVPAQFMVFFKTAATGDCNAQLMKSAGPIPGVVGSLSGAVLKSAVSYSPELVDIDAVTPRVLAVGERIRASFFGGVAVYIKWKGQ